MVPVNIYTLTRIKTPALLSKLERQMSGRRKALKIKSWEMTGLRDFCERLCAGSMQEFLPLFYYSFVMPKLGKEFDLLRIGENFVLNVELKSGHVTDEAIKRQLLQNRYYLAMLGRSIHSYTYVSDTGRLVRLSNSGHLVEAQWESLRKLMIRQSGLYSGDIEELFKEEQFLISPLTDPGKFLRKEYFLTSQQRDIRKQILRRIRLAAQVGEEPPVQGFTGFPGTGKTLLLYDIALELSVRNKVCIFHCGAHTPEMEQLDDRLKRVDFYYMQNGPAILPEAVYSAVLVDEGHNADEEHLRKYLSLAKAWHAPVVITYDREDTLSPEEGGLAGAERIESLPGYKGYHLTNRIRLNKEISSFIRQVLHYKEGEEGDKYPSVSVAYGADQEEASRLLDAYRKQGYVYICDPQIDRRQEIILPEEIIPFSEAGCREYLQVVMYLNRDFYYDECGYLRYGKNMRGIPGAGAESRVKPENDANPEKAQGYVRNLFHGLSRAREKVALVIENNPAVFSRILTILQP